MSVQPIFTPKSTLYVRYDQQYQQITENFESLTLSSGVDSVTQYPAIVRLFGNGFAQLSGSVTPTGTATSLAELPDNIIPINDYFVPVTVLRSNAYVANAVKVHGEGQNISSVIVDTVGSYTVIPTVTTTGPGKGAVLTARMRANSATVTGAGTGYVTADTITLAGGTSSQTAVFTVSSTKLTNVSISGAGTGYTPGDTVTLAGGTFTTAAIINVVRTRLESVALNSGGTGYAPGNTITLAGGAGPVPAVITVGTVSGGVITGFSITNAGSYTANSSTFSQASTSGSGTGATFNTAVYGIGTLSLSNGGAYTVNPSSFTQGSTSGSGTGATFSTPVFGVNAGTFSTPGNYSVIPSNPVLQASTSGSGTGCTLTVSWGVLSVTVSNDGYGFTKDSDVSFSSSAGSGATGTLVLDGTPGLIALVNAPQANDVVCLDSVSFITTKYGS